jgi:signal transduction histidine kinase
MISFLRQRLLSLPGPLALMIVVLLVLLIGVVGFFTGPDISISIFFVVPVFIATWVLGLRQGVVTALVSALVWMSADVLSNHAYHHSWIVFWNTLVRLGFFLLTVALLAQIKAQETRRRLLERIFFHDVLNVATGLRGFAELLQHHPRQNCQEIYGEIYSAADQVINEIEEQRTLSAAESHDLHPVFQPVHSWMLLSKVVEIYQHSSAAAGKTVALAPDTAREIFESDESLLCRVLGNMLKNALEAAAKGETVTVGCRRQGPAIEFWVHNPQYIPRASQAGIFRPSFSTKGNDRGLGTYSMKLLTGLLQGEVSFTSIEGEGTTFRARYPLAPRKG